MREKEKEYDTDVQLSLSWFWLGLLLPYLFIDSQDYKYWAAAFVASYWAGVLVKHLCIAAAMKKQWRQYIDGALLLGPIISMYLFLPEPMAVIAMVAWYTGNFAR